MNNNNFGINSKKQFHPNGRLSSIMNFDHNDNLLNAKNYNENGDITYQINNSYNTSSKDKPEIPDYSFISQIDYSRTNEIGEPIATSSIINEYGSIDKDKYSIATPDGTKSFEYYAVDHDTLDYVKNNASYKAEIDDYQKYSGVFTGYFDDEKNLMYAIRNGEQDATRLVGHKTPFGGNSAYYDNMINKLEPINDSNYVKSQYTPEPRRTQPNANNNIPSIGDNFIDKYNEVFVLNEISKKNPNAGLSFDQYNYLGDKGTSKTFFNTDGQAVPGTWNPTEKLYTPEMVEGYHLARHEINNLNRDFNAKISSTSESLYAARYERLINESKGVIENHNSQVNVLKQANPNRVESDANDSYKKLLGHVKEKQEKVDSFNNILNEAYEINAGLSESKEDILNAIKNNDYSNMSQLAKNKDYWQSRTKGNNSNESSEKIYDYITDDNILNEANKMNYTHDYQKELNNQRESVKQMSFVNANMEKQPNYSQGASAFMKSMTDNVSSEQFGPLIANKKESEYFTPESPVGRLHDKYQTRKNRKETARIKQKHQESIAQNYYKNQRDLMDFEKNAGFGPMDSELMKKYNYNQNNSSAYKNLSDKAKQKGINEVNSKEYKLNQKNKLDANQKAYLDTKSELRQLRKNKDKYDPDKYTTEAKRLKELKKENRKKRNQSRDEYNYRNYDPEREALEKAKREKRIKNQKIVEEYEEKRRFVKGLDLSEQTTNPKFAKEYLNQVGAKDYGEAKEFLNNEKSSSTNLDDELHSEPRDRYSSERAIPEAEQTIKETAQAKSSAEEFIHNKGNEFDYRESKLDLEKNKNSKEWKDEYTKLTKDKEQFATDFLSNEKSLKEFEETVGFGPMTAETMEQYEFNKKHEASYNGLGDDIKAKGAENLDNIEVDAIRKEREIRLKSKLDSDQKAYEKINSELRALKKNKDSYDPKYYNEELERLKSLKQEAKTNKSTSKKDYTRRENPNRLGSQINKYQNELDALDKFDQLDAAKSSLAEGKITQEAFDELQGELFGKKTPKKPTRARADIEKDILDNKKLIKNFTGRDFQSGDDIVDSLKKKVKGANKLNVAISGLTAISQYKDSRKEGKGVVSSVVRAGMDFALAETLGGTTYMALNLVTKLPTWGVKGAEKLHREVRGMNTASRFTVFGDAQFQDTEQLATMRQSGMELAKMSQYRLEQSLMGSEAKYLHR